MTHNFSDFNIITLTLGDTKPKLLTGKLAKACKPLEDSRLFLGTRTRCPCWVLCIHFYGQN